MKLELGYGGEIYGTVEVDPTGTRLAYEGPEQQAMQNLVEDLARKFPHADTNLDAFLAWLPTHLRGRTWARRVSNQISLEKTDH